MKEERKSEEERGGGEAGGEEEVILNLTKHHIKALFLLDKYGYLLFHDFRVALRRGYEQTLVMLRELMDWGLVDMITIGMKRKIRAYCLSRKGKRVVSLLKELAKESKK